MTHTVLPSEWLALPEAALKLEKSTKTVERLGRAGLVRTKLEQRPGRRAERLYSADDLERAKTEGFVASQARPEAGVRTAASASANGVPALVPARKGKPLPGVQMLQEVYSRDLPRLVERYWLTLSEASALAGLSKALLKREAREGRLLALKDPAWKISRDALAEWKPGAKRKR